MPYFDALSEINGWSVIGNVATSDGNLILAERYKDTPGIGVGYCLAYVVAFLPMGSEEWVSGRYFDGDRTKENRTAAKAFFLQRVSDSIWS